MNKLIIPNGGMPLEGDDFRWFQDGYAEAFKGVFSEIARRVSTSVLGQGQVGFFIHPNYEGNFVITGCEVTSIGSGNVSVAEGFVFIDGEVLYFPAVASMPEAAPGFGYAFRLVVTYDPAGLEVFQTGGSFDTYEIRRAEIYTLSASPTVPSARDFRLVDLLSYGDVNNPLRDLDGETSLSNGWVDATPIIVRKINGRVYMEGELTPGTWAQPGLTLSSGFRPSRPLRQMVPWGNDGIALVIIGNNGWITPRQIITPTAFNNLDLSQINFTVA